MPMMGRLGAGKQAASQRPSSRRRRVFSRPVLCFALLCLLAYLWVVLQASDERETKRIVARASDESHENVKT